MKKGTFLFLDLEELLSRRRAAWKFECPILWPTFDKLCIITVLMIQAELLWCSDDY